MTRRSVLALAILLAVPFAAASHPGHQHKVMGVVTMVHENHLEVKSTDGRITTFTLSEKTRIRRGKTLVTAADIAVGDRVVVVTEETKDASGKPVISVVEVQLGTAPRAGGETPARPEW